MMRAGTAEIVTVEDERTVLSRHVALPESPWLRLIDLAGEGLIVTALLGELVLVLANVLARVYFHH